MSKKPSLEEARAKIRTFCNFRDRSHREVKDKLYSMGLYSSEVDQILLQMMEEDLLNEERYARSFVRGHFYQKRWGWIKIESALRQQGIHSNLLKHAKKEIDESDYRATAKFLATKKWKEVEGEPALQRMAKVYRYLTSKGFESQLVNAIVKDLHSAK